MDNRNRPNKIVSALRELMPEMKYSTNPNEKCLIEVVMKGEISTAISYGDVVDFLEGEAGTQLYRWGHKFIRPQELAEEVMAALKENPDMRFSKALSKGLRRFALDSTQLSVLGEMWARSYKQQAPKPTVLPLYMGMHDKIDFTADDFGNPSSCWWDEDQYDYSRTVFDYNGGYGLLLYIGSSRLPHGRIWLLPTSTHKALLFNLYCRGTWRLRHFANFLKELVPGMKYDNVDLSGTGEYEMYINPNPVELYVPVGEGEEELEYEITTRDSGGYLRLDPYDWATESKRSSWTCYECGEDYDDGVSSYYVDDHDYCEYCYNRHCACCDSCYEDGLRSSMTETHNGNWYCKDCVDRGRVDIAPCESCEEWYDIDDLNCVVTNHYGDIEYRCRYCGEVEQCNATSCYNYALVDDMTDTEDGNVCPECAHKKYTPCEKCENTVTSNRICEKCEELEKE